MSSNPPLKGLYWNDVSTDTVVPGYDLQLTETKIVEQVSGSQDFYPPHHSREFVRDAGYPEIFVNTAFTGAALSRLLTAWVGVSGWVCGLRFELRRMNRLGDAIRIRASVVKKYVDTDGLGYVDLRVWIENDRDGVSTPGTATVVLPLRN